jgi:hypothetical protein
MGKGKNGQTTKPDSFGKKKKGIAKKKYNKHSPKPKEYRGQGK